MAQEWKDIVFDETHGLGLDIYIPEDGPYKAVFVFFHSAGGQPTTHFNVLKEMGLDSRAVIADERSPLYHVREKGAPLLVLCTDRDIKNRKEQTDLFVSTLKHFQYESPVEYLLLEGYGHSNYLFPDEKKPQKPSYGSGIIAEFIQKYC